MNPNPDDFEPNPDPASSRPGAFAAVIPGSGIDEALDRRLDAMKGCIIGSLRQQFHRPFPNEAGIAAWLVECVRCEGPCDSRAAGLVPAGHADEETLAAELKWHLHLNADRTPLRELHERYTDAVSAVVDFDRLTLDPPAAEADLRAAIRAGRVPGLEGFAGMARLAMREARESVRRHEVDRLVEGVELFPGEDAVAVLLAQGLRVRRLCSGQGADRP